MTHTDDSRAIILGGGGITGISWEIGVLAGLASEGIALDAVDAVIGTSAGSFAAVEIFSGTDLQDRYAAQFSSEHHEITASMTPESQQAYRAAIQGGYPDKVAMAKNLGAMAIGAKTVSTEARTEVIAHRLPITEWPVGPLKITALDAATGELHLLDRDSGVTLSEAVAASGAVPGLWPVVDAGGRKWIGGGSVSAANVELAADYTRVLVIAPVVTGFPGTPTVEDILSGLDDKVSVVLISPDERTKEAIGENVFDPSRRGAAAEAGRAQGLAMADAVKTLFAPKN
jgi:NTE family protein